MATRSAKFVAHDTKRDLQNKIMEILSEQKN